MKRVYFRVYPDKKHSCYYSVYIFRTEEEMFRHFKRTNIDPVVSGQLDFRAICQSWNRYTVEVDGKRTKHPEIGQLLFCAEDCGAGVVSHEITHATTYWVRKRTRMSLAKLYDDKEIDEKYAWALGYMVSQFWTKYWKQRQKAQWLKL